MARRDRKTPAQTPAQAPAQTPAEATPTPTPEVDEVAEPTAEPEPDARPVKPVGTSNLACTIRQHRKRYSVALAPSGKKTANNGDDVARILLATPLSALSAFVMARFGKRYDHLNTGHERMCCGNLVRAFAKKGDTEVLDWLAANDPRNATPADEAEEA